jgi:plasmid stabilization system protein ParE
VVVRYQTLISGPASRDVQRIWKYLHEQSPSGAKSVRDQILDQISNLELFPRRNIVKAKPGMDLVRSTVVGNFIIYFSGHREAEVGEDLAGSARGAEEIAPVRLKC